MSVESKLDTIIANQATIIGNQATILTAVQNVAAGNDVNVETELNAIAAQVTAINTTLGSEAATATPPPAAGASSTSGGATS